MDTWIGIAVVITLGALVIDRTRAYRVLPFALSRLRGRPRPARRADSLEVDSTELATVRVNRSDVAGSEKELINGEGD